MCQLPAQFGSCSEGSNQFPNSRLDSSLTDKIIGGTIRDHLPAMPAIEVEVGIGREYYGSAIVSVMRTRQASAKLNGTLCVFSQERYHWLHAVVQIETRDHSSPQKQRAQTRPAQFAKQMVGFRQHCFAGVPR